MRSQALNLKHLRYFAEVARRGSVTRACTAPAQPGRRAVPRRLAAVVAARSSVMERYGLELVGRTDELRQSVFLIRARGRAFLSRVSARAARRA